jgi:aminopeptidase N
LILGRKLCEFRELDRVKHRLRYAFAVNPSDRRVRGNAMSRHALAAAMYIFIVAGVLADTYPRQPGVRIVNYDFDVTVSDTSDEISVRDTVTMRFTANGVRGMDLDLCKLITQPQSPNRLNPCLVPAPRVGSATTSELSQPPNSVGRGMTVTDVKDGTGRELRYRHDQDRLHVDFPEPSVVDELYSFTVSYHGVPADGLFIGHNRYGDRVFFTDNWPNKARNWLATEDHISTKTTKSISVTAPSHYQVISNGALQEQTDLPNDMRRTNWRESVPVPSWQFSLGIARLAVEHFGEFRGVPLSAWVFPQNRESGFHAIDQNTPLILEFYTSRFGPYQYEKLAQVEAAGSSGATEPASTIFYYGGFGASSHEIAHHWFGDSITESDWDDVWLSEGFATYCALLYTEQVSGRDAFLAGIRRARDRAMAYELANPNDTIIHNNLSNISDVFFNSAQIYQGGAMVLHMLRGVLGDKNFFAGMKLYSSRYRNGSASTTDFRHAMEDACAVTGDCPPENRDLSWFFSEWLNRGGVLQLDGSWHYDAAAKQLIVKLDQTQKQGLFRMPIEIGYTLPPLPQAKSAPQTADGSSITGVQRMGSGHEGASLPRIGIGPRHIEARIPLDREPSDVQLDTNFWVPMMQVTFVKK